MIGQTLVESNEIVRKVTERRRAQQQCHTRIGGQGFQSAGDPASCRNSIDEHLAAAQQGSSGLRLFVTDRNSGARGRGRERGREAGRSRADDQHIAMSIAVRVVVRIGTGRCAAQSGRAAQEGLVQGFPGAPWPHESFVVEARGCQTRQPPTQCARVETQTGPAVLALCLKSVVDFNLRGLQVGGVSRESAAYRDQGIRLLGPGAKNAPRPAILE